VSGPSPFEAEIALAKLKKYQLPGSDQIPAEVIEAGGEILLPAIHKFVNSVWNREELPDQWKELTRRVTKLTVIIIVGYQCYKLHTQFYRISSSQG
jgi:hypothetical protein